MDNPKPSSFLISAVDAACDAAMKLKRSKKEPFTCLVLRVEREKQTYDIVPVYSTSYELSVEAARQQVAEWHDTLLFYVIVSDGNVTMAGKSSDAIVIEACEVEQRIRFQLVRRYTPPGLFSKAKAEEQLVLVRAEPDEKRLSQGLSLRPDSLGKDETAAPDRVREAFSESAKVSGETRGFIAKLAASDIWILAVGLRGTPVIPSITDPAAFDIIAAHRIDVSEIGDNDSVFPFNYEQAGRQTLPFFSSEERARYFMTNSGLRIDLSTVFQPYCLLAGFVATPENEIFELILDPGSPAERRLGPDERLLLCSLTTSA
jgi:hypothetical protein